MVSTEEALQQPLQPLLEVDLEMMLRLQQLLQPPLPLEDLLLLLQLPPEEEEEEELLLLLQRPPAGSCSPKSDSLL